MSRFLASATRHRDTYRPAPRFLVAFGVIFVFAGIITLLGGDSHGINFGAIVVGVAFLGLGSLVVIGRPKITIDYLTRKIIDRSSIFYLFRTRRYQFDDFKGIELCKVLRNSNNKRHAVYTVNLSGSAKIMVMEFDQFLAARRCGETLAHKLALSLTDAVEGKNFTRLPDSLQRNLRESLVENAGEMPPPELKHIGGWIERQDGRVSIRLPAPKYDARTATESITSILAIFLIGYFTFGFENIVGAFSTAIIAALLAAATVAMPAAHHRFVVLERNQIAYVRRLGPLRWSRALDVNELEEVRALGRGRMVLRSDDEQIILRGLTAEEMSEIRRYIEFWLVTESQDLPA